MKRYEQRIEFLDQQIKSLSKKLLYTDNFDIEYSERIKKLTDLRNERDSLKEVLSHGK